jgi:hypothetical protein
MATTPYAALGTQIWVGDGGSPDTFFKVARVQDIQGPKVKTDLIDVTTHDAALVDGGDGYKQYIGSLKDGQQITFPVVLDPNDITQNETATVVGTNAGGLKYLCEQNAIRNCRIAFPQVSPTCRIRLKMLFTGFDFEAKVTGSVMATLTAQCIGKPTLEVGSGSGV